MSFLRCGKIVTTYADKPNINMLQSVVTHSRHFMLFMNKTQYRCAVLIHKKLIMDVGIIIIIITIIIIINKAAALATEKNCSREVGDILSAADIEFL